MAEVAVARLSFVGFYTVSTDSTRNTWRLRYYYEGLWHEMDLFTTDFAAAFSLANRWLAIRTVGIQWTIAA